MNFENLTLTLTNFILVLFKQSKKEPLSRRLHGGRQEQNARSFTFTYVNILNNRHTPARLRSMAQMKFITAFLVILMFAAGFSISHAHQDGDGDSEVSTTFSKGKGVVDEETATIATKQIVGGRKMSPVVKERNPENMKESSGSAIERTPISSTSSHSLAGICDGKLKENAIDCKKTVSHNHISHEDVDDKGCVAFDADYHAPRHHPPQNN
ncbi:hypothetical protein Ddye_030762 [Dipteronia dyeriana]|uniref:Uncharacterized protein n=1 Tax=Dipteronia dyeriana TaxID=168575 RepID=A0AAD9WN17_9ROSI|nr:hypothetical protein Ddye_030762 [Dipteronia dyeriana]